MKKRILSELAEVMWHAVEQSPGTVVITDANHLIRYANHSYCQHTGYSLADMDGKNLFAFQEDLIPPATLAEIRATLTAGKPWSGELRNRRKNGDLFWENCVISAVRNPDGSIGYFLKVSEDVSGQKASGNDLKESQQRYERIVTAMRGFMFTVYLKNGRPLNTTYYPGTLQVTGYSVEEYHSDPMLWFNMIYEEDRPAVKGQIASIKDGKDIQSIEHRIYHKNGSIRWVKNFSVPTFDIAGQLVAYDGLITDINDLKDAELHRDKLLNELRRMAVRDALTGLFSRRGLEDELTRAWQLGSRHQQGTGILILDIDHFKVINDTYGHNVGDLVLIEFAKLITTTVRMADIVCRYGGDEIVIILPLTECDETVQIAERLRTACERHTFCTDTHDLHATVSIGTACEQGDTDTSPQRILTQADQALFRAKQSGRNRVCVWEGEQSVTTDEPASTPAGAELTISASSPSAHGKGLVLVVDDEEPIRHLMLTILKQAGYQALTAADAAEASLLAVKFKGTIDIALIDLALGHVNGLEVLQQLRQLDDTMVGIILTGHATVDNAANAMRFGASDFISKPVSFDLLLMALERGMRYRQLLRENQSYQRHLEKMVAERSAALSRALNQVKQSYRGTLEVLANMLETRESQTGEHCKRVANMARELATEMGLTPEEIDIVHRGALMHDIGKIIIPDAILLKKGPLTPEEWIIVKQHPQTGYDIVRACPAMEKVSEIVFSHQERYDGSGYPRGLKGNLICLGARIFAIIDTYDAIRSNRPYSSGKSAEVAIAQIKAGRGTQFDPEVVDAFYRCQPRIEACL